MSIFLDLSKACDTVDHAVLHQKLSFNDVSGSEHKWFENYLSNGKQFVI